MGDQPSDEGWVTRAQDVMPGKTNIQNASFKYISSRPHTIHEETQRNVLHVDMYTVKCILLLQFKRQRHLSLFYWVAYRHTITILHCIIIYNYTGAGGICAPITSVCY